MNWRDYEIYIHKHFQGLFPDAVIRHNVKKLGVISKVERQIDIYIKGKVAGFDLNIVVDCKYFSRKIDVKVIESFISFLHDLKANKGVIITNSGYSKAAYNRAYYDTQDVEIRIIKFEELKNFQSFAAIPYAAPYCVYLPAPDGWVIDATPNANALASLYPLGLSEPDAFKNEGYMYINFIKKDSEYPNLITLTSKQDEKIRLHFPVAKIEYIDTIKRDLGNVMLRVAEIGENYKGLEYTLFVDFKDFIAFIVLLEPYEKRGEYFKKLEWTGQRLVPGKIVYDSRNEPYCVPLKTEKT